MAFFVEDEAQHVHQELRREEGRRAALVVVGRHLDEVEADDVALFGQALEDLQYLVIKEAAVARRAGAGRDRGVTTTSPYQSRRAAPPGVVAGSGGPINTSDSS